MKTLKTGQLLSRVITVSIIIVLFVVLLQRYKAKQYYPEIYSALDTHMRAARDQNAELVYKQWLHLDEGGKMTFVQAKGMVMRRALHEHYSAIEIDSLIFFGGNIAAVRGICYYSDGFQAPFSGQLQHHNAKWKIRHLDLFIDRGSVKSQ